MLYEFRERCIFRNKIFVYKAWVCLQKNVFDFCQKWWKCTEAASSWKTQNQIDQVQSVLPTRFSKLSGGQRTILELIFFFSNIHVIIYYSRLTVVDKRRPLHHQGETTNYSYSGFQMSFQLDKSVFAVSNVAELQNGSINRNLAVAIIFQDEELILNSYRVEKA